MPYGKIYLVDVELHGSKQVVVESFEVDRNRQEFGLGLTGVSYSKPNWLSLVENRAQMWSSV